MYICTDAKAKMTLQSLSQPVQYLDHPNYGTIECIHHAAQPVATRMDHVDVRSHALALTSQKKSMSLYVVSFFPLRGRHTMCVRVSQCRHPKDPTSIIYKAFSCKLGSTPLFVVTDTGRWINQPTRCDDLSSRGHMGW